MKAVSFRLSGKTACFRKPDVNQYAYFTYNNIHKPALLGILGAVLGLAGHIQLSNENRGIEEENRAIKKKADKKPLNSGYPEFYEKLKGLKIAIIPLAPHGYFSKKIQVFNNSVGYASKEMGGNLIVREQWLENPEWQIIVLDDGTAEYMKLKEYLIERKSVFVPYLGKNDHPANIDEVEAIHELQDTLFDIDGEYYIDSLFIKAKGSFGMHRESDDAPFMFQEVSPMRLQKQYHFYEYETLIFTNYEPLEIPKDTYCYEDKNYTFI
jgi:CRISPR-associated protein Cas5h